MSIRQDIKAALKVKLLTIISGTTYATTIVKVHDKVLELTEVSESDFPSLAIASLMERVVKGESLREHTWGLVLIGYVKVAQDYSNAGNLTAEYEKIYNDVQVLIDANPELGVEDVVDVEVTGLDPYLDDSDTKGFFTIGLQVIYNTDF